MIPAGTWEKRYRDIHLEQTQNSRPSKLRPGPAPAEEDAPIEEAEEIILNEDDTQEAEENFDDMESSEPEEVVDTEE